MRVEVNKSQFSHLVFTNSLTRSDSVSTNRLVNTPFLFICAESPPRLLFISLKSDCVQLKNNFPNQYQFQICKLTIILKIFILTFSVLAANDNSMMLTFYFSHDSRPLPQCVCIKPETGTVLFQVSFQNTSKGKSYYK